jgi:hypothetical protein
MLRPDRNSENLFADVAGLRRVSSWPRRYGLGTEGSPRLGGLLRNILRRLKFELLRPFELESLENNVAALVSCLSSATACLGLVSVP